MGVTALFVTDITVGVLLAEVFSNEVLVIVLTDTKLAVLLIIGVAGLGINKLSPANGTMLLLSTGAEKQTKQNK